MGRASGVAVVGSINVDLMAYGKPLPRPGETRVAAGFTTGLGGKGANQAVAAARAGAAVCMIGAVGDDPFGVLSREALTAAGVDTGAVAVTEEQTGVAHIRVEQTSGQNDILLFPGANSRLTPALVERELRQRAESLSVVLVQLETPLPTVQATARLCAGLGLRLVLDPAPAQALPDAVWADVAVVTPNETEAEELTGLRVADQAGAEAAGRWFRERGVAQAVITLGSRGAIWVAGTGTGVARAFPVRAVDTTAAGDVFTGTLGAALAAGRDWASALERAMAAAALAVTVRGASTSAPDAAAVEEFLARRSGG